jgi:ATP-dependent helicase/DNAse subunit B
MPTPLPWSPSALSDYKNCPFAYYRKRVVKDVKDEGGEALQWGNKVHKAFELYIKEGKPLPDVLKEHQKLLDVLARWATSAGPSARSL